MNDYAQWVRRAEEAEAEVRRLRQALYLACVMVDMPDGVVLNHEDGTARYDGEAGA